ncbi:MAG: hypothetical protein V3U27_17270 [Candidatus Tectomicrobia bacterium]
MRHLIVRQKVLDRILLGVPEDERAKIGGENTARLYNLEVARLV